ncbi:MAG: hypothetical protein IIA48_04905 [Bacteroidetes bacterium]|nr:hypothetical protein [Bacteroidota bacterium]
MNIKNMKRVKLYLSEFQLKETKKVIKKIDMNISEFVRRAIEEYLGKVKKRDNIK